MNKNIAHTNIKTNIVYGNGITKKPKDFKNEALPLSREYSNESWQQRVDRIMDMQLPDKKKGGRK